MIPLVSIRTGRELGWPEGLEPSTGGSTNRCSAIELWPPRSEREYSPKARVAAKDAIDAAGPTTPSIPTSPDCTQPRRTYPAPDRTARYLGAPGDRTIAPRTYPNPQPTVATSPEYPRTPPEYAVRMSFPIGSWFDVPPDSPESRGVATTDRPRDRPPVRHQLGVHVRRAVRDLRLGHQLVQLLVGGRPRRADQPQPRERRAQGAQGRLARSPRSPAGAART